MEEFFLRGILARDELDIVHQKDIRFAVALMEILSGAVTDSVNHFVREIVAFYINDCHFRVVLGNGIVNSPEKMGLSQAGISIDKEGIIEGGGFCGHRHAGCMGKFIGGAYDKGVESIFVILRGSRYFLFGGNLFRNYKADAESHAENVLQRLCKKRGIASGQRLPVKIIRHLQDGNIPGKIQFHRLNAADPCCEGHFCYAAFAVIAD